ncbi:YicC family protein [Methylothermus subterraneus]|nr:hypothetical conserved protein [uncultured Gammaproteobacteria bacterium]BAL55747.1 hypothetical conserved protein [uncultured Gammaproteobacteria bacterium]
MVQSMTGFVAHEDRIQQCAVRWEIRALNSRYLDLSLRLPDSLRFVEPELRALTHQRLKRGKVECSLRLEPLPEASLVLEINRPMANAVIRALLELESLLRIPATVSLLDLARWPGVLQEPKLDEDSLIQTVLAGFQAALEELTAVRRREGQKLAEVLRAQCAELRAQVGKARQALPKALEAVRAKLLARIEELNLKPDFDRLEQELVYLAQRLDVNEELDRLDAHLDEIERLLGQDQPVGRRLDFLCQEMNREANTLAAKAASGELTQCAIECKVWIEQMREQVQNLE